MRKSFCIPKRINPKWKKNIIIIKSVQISEHSNWKNVLNIFFGFLFNSAFNAQNIRIHAFKKKHILLEQILIDVEMYLIPMKLPAMKYRVASLQSCAWTSSGDTLHSALHADSFIHRILSSQHFEYLCIAEILLKSRATNEIPITGRTPSSLTRQPVGKCFQYALNLEFNLESFQFALFFLVAATADGCASFLFFLMLQKIEEVFQ